MSETILLAAGDGIGRWSISPSLPPFVVAEMSGNHNGSIDRAMALIEAAAAAGAHGFKIQTFEVDHMAAEGKVVALRGSPWNGKTFTGLYAQTVVPRAWHKAIFRRAADCGMIPFSTPFSPRDVDFLEAECGPACYKIASFELVDLQLIKRAARTMKPLFLSTGMATAAEIWEAVHTAREHGSGEIVLLKCTSAYPAQAEDANLATIPHMAAWMRCPVGLSDHTPGVGVAVAAVAMGAAVVEKHLTLCRADGGPDAHYSMEPGEFAQLVRETAIAWSARGVVAYGATQAERPSLAFRRSLHVVADLRAGDVLSGANLAALRPAGGVEPRYWDVVIGMAVVGPVRAGTPLSWDMLR